MVGPDIWHHQICQSKLIGDGSTFFDKHLAESKSGQGSAPAVISIGSKSIQLELSSNFNSSIANGLGPKEEDATTIKLSRILRYMLSSNSSSSGSASMDNGSRERTGSSFGRFGLLVISTDIGRVNFVVTSAAVHQFKLRLNPVILGVCT